VQFQLFHLHRKSILYNGLNATCVFIKTYQLSVENWVTNIYQDITNYTHSILVHSKNKFPVPLLSTYLNTGEEQFEQVNSLKYLGSMVNAGNSTEEEIKERIVAGNRAYRVKKLFTSK